MDFLVLAASRKWAMLAIVLTCGIVAVAITYILPQTFLGAAVILPPDRLSSSSLLTKLNAGYALEILKEVENPSVDLLQNIIESRSLSERLSRDSTLHRYFSAEGYRGAEIVKAIHTAVKVGPGFSKVDVQGTLETGWFPTAAEKEQTREMSAYITNLAITVMDSTIKAAIRSLSHDTRVYADSDYALKRRELDSLDARQEAFEQAHGVVKLEAQTKAAIDRVAALKADRDQAEIKLRLLEMDMSDHAASKEEVMAEIRAAEQAAISYESRPQIGPSLDSLPEVSRAYAEILSDRKQLEPIVSFLRVEAEQQRIFEVREKSLITVMDPARVPDTRISPIRSAVGFLGLVIGVALSVIYVGIQSLQLAWVNEQARRGLNSSSQEVESAKRIFPRRAA